MSIDIGIATNSLASLLLFLLLVVQLGTWSSRKSSIVLLGATTLTLVWCLSLLLQEGFNAQWFYLLPLVEILKNISWFALLLSILGIRKLVIPSRSDQQKIKGLALVSSVSLGVPLVLLVYLLYTQFISKGAIYFPGYGGRNIILGFLITSIVGLALLEQVIRNTRYQHGWYLKYLCLGLGILFTFDLYMYSEALLFDRIDESLWQIRGGIMVLAIPLIATGIIRSRQQPIQLNISRRLVFHTGVLVSSGIYLLLMSAAGYYIRSFSGEWGSLLQVMFWVVSLSVLLALIYSGRMRSLFKMYISRNLFSSKYDYRDEWMRISRTLSQTNSDESLPDRAIHALADIVDSPAGALWLTTNGTHYDQVAQVELGWIENSGLKVQDTLIQYMKTSKQLIDLSDPHNELEVSQLPPWLNDLKKAWLIVPLDLHGDLLGFVLLKESRVEIKLNWEEYDLMKAAGQQTASYLAQMVTSDALSEARQFSAFNQGSAFVVHDIKTLNSQLSMLVSNAAKHKSNPSFIEDMIKTTDHAVKKMDFLLKHFKSHDQSDEQSEKPLDLVEIVEQVVDTKSNMKPSPQFTCAEASIVVSANEAELKSSIGHLIQNALEAALDEGSVNISLRTVIDEGVVELTIKDSGSGMSQEFIQTRLFKPFESTKGLTGMGIGVFQSRESIRKLGGDLIVNSQVNEGTEIKIILPMINSAGTG